VISASDRRRLDDMVVHARHAIDLLADRSGVDLGGDLRTRFAVIHCVEIVGEAAAQVSGPGRQAVEGLPWARIVGMRNTLIHGYPDVDLDRVVNVVRNDLPALVAAIHTALEDENP
jgi:uncharacterized protein with HEPN domain